MNIYFNFSLLSIFLISLTKSHQDIIELKIRQTPTKEENNPNGISKYILSRSATSENYKVYGSTLLDLTKMKEGLYTIRLAVGSSKQEFEVILDTGSFLLWIPSDACNFCLTDNRFLINNSTTLHKSSNNIKLRYVSGTISGSVSDDILQVGSLSIKKFHFLLSDIVEVPLTVDGIVGLSRTYDRYSDDFSILQSLYKEGVIKKRIFSQKIGRNDEDSKFSIGSLPKEIQDDLGHYTTCKTIKNNAYVNSYWACYLSKVLIVNSSHSITSPDNVTEVSNKVYPAIFDTGSNVIMAPLEYFQIFKENFFGDLINSNKCSCLEDTGNAKGFKCNGNLKQNLLPSLRFVFDNDQTYEIDTSDLFIKEKADLMFRIVFTQVPGNGWLLGQPFLKQFHVVFDKDNELVGFYSRNPGRITSMNDIRVTTTIQLQDKDYTFIVISCLISYYLIGGVVALVIIFLKKKKNSNITVVPSMNYNNFL